jgi:hypothetical protein
MAKGRGRSAEPRSKDVPAYVDAPPRDATSLDPRGASTFQDQRGGRSEYATSDDDETEAQSLTSRASKKKKFKKMFKRKKKKKKYKDNNGDISVSSHFKSGSQEFYRGNSSFNEVELLAQKKGRMSQDDRFKVMPDASYPNTYMNREELRQEMNYGSAYYHDLRVPYKKGQEIGQLRLEVLQCFGLPSASVLRDVSAYVIAVCGSHAFKTDTMPAVPNPMWLSQMRRACMFPVFNAFDKVFIGVFDNGQGDGSSNSDFIGRVSIDVARLRAGCMYDITLPLRQSAHVFTRNQQGALRVRIHLIWVSERSAVTSYLPKSKPKFQPDETNKINCLDERSFRNVAHLVHGSHMPGKFSMTLLKATIREMNFNRIHIFRYMRRREIYNLRYWVYPFISGFVFCAWMHSVVANTTRYIPGHILTFFVMRLYLNYAYYAMDSPLQNGFTAPSMEELFDALLYGTKGRRKKYIKALNMETDESNVINPEKHLEAEFGYDEANKGDVQISDIADAMRKSIRVQRHKYRLRTYRNAFVGTEAVDFLTNFGYAYTRSEAVIVGRRLAKELKLFEHVGRKHEFDDDSHYYHFLNYDTKKYVITGHYPRFKRIFQSIGFVNKDIIPGDDHVEFPFAEGTSHPRFTVKEALVLRSTEAKKMMKEKEEASEIVDCAEFGVAPSLMVMEEEVDMNQSLRPAELMRTGIRRGSTVASATLNAAVNLPQNLMNLPQNLGQNLARRRTMEFGDPEELYGKLKERHNPTLDELLESRKLNTSNFDPYADDSDDDVETISKKRRKGTVIEEKILAKPPNQDFSKRSGGGDKPFAKSMGEMRHKVHGMAGHLFNDRVYKIDQSLFPIKHAEEKDADTKSVSTKRGIFGQRKRSNEGSEYDKDKKKKKDVRTPYDARVDEYDKILQINKYSHPNPWINRVAVMVQPMVEIVQVPLFFSRAIFNLMTWQDPILSFWLAIIGPVLVLVFHFLPYRLLAGIAGVYLFGPQNWLYRLFQQTKPGFEPLAFDRIVKRKKIQKQEPYSEIQLFSSMAPGNQHIKFKNVDPQQVRQVVIPSSVLKYSRFYDWPPEPEYARVYQAPPPRNLSIRKSTKEMNAADADNGEAHSDGGGSEAEEGYESSESFWYDATLARTKKKKKKKGLKKVGHQIKKGTGAVVGGSLEAGGAFTGAVVGVTGAVVGTTFGATMGVAKGMCG